ncbi:NADPH-dependent FMN reductase [Cucumibacter marinus]|uniref:NADPH-dependent FMN reductase n=1 Tax=Cucumibacter marinus TaxID=1121252 RepID=UPI00040536E9|nr:NADPH-dependent FMN reductase [Cucumibacter marinus]
MVKAFTLSGSVRRDSYNARLARLMAQKLAEAGADAAYVDLGEYTLPVFNEDLEENEFPDKAMELGGLLREADAIFFATPEYNGGIAPLTKNTIDWLTRTRLKVFARPTFGLGACSSGKLSGVVGLSHLRETLTKIGALTVPAQVRIGPIEDDFDAEGNLVDEGALRACDRVVEQLMITRRQF